MRVRVESLLGVPWVLALLSLCSVTRLSSGFAGMSDSSLGLRTADDSTIPAWHTIETLTA